MKIFDLKKNRIIFNREYRSITGTGYYVLKDKLAAAYKRFIEKYNTVGIEKTDSPIVKKFVQTEYNRSPYLNSYVANMGELNLTWYFLGAPRTIVKADKVSTLGENNVLEEFNQDLKNFTTQLEIGLGIFNSFEAGFRLAVLVGYNREMLMTSVSSVDGQVYDNNETIDTSWKMFEPAFFVKYKLLDEQNNFLNLTVQAEVQPDISKDWLGGGFYNYMEELHTDYAVYSFHLFFDKTFSFFTPFLYLSYEYKDFADEYSTSEDNSNEVRFVDKPLNFKISAGFEYRVTDDFYLFPKVEFDYEQETVLNQLQEWYDSSLGSSPFTINKKRTLETLKLWIIGIGFVYDIGYDTAVSFYLNMVLPLTFKYTEESANSNENSTMYLRLDKEYRVYMFLNTRFDLGF